MNSFDFKVSHRTWTLWFSLGIDIWGIPVYSRNHSGIGGSLHQCRKFFCCKTEVPFLQDVLPLKKVNWKRSRKVGDQGRMAKFILILGDKSGRLLPLPSSVFYCLNSRSSTSFCGGNRPSPFFLGQLSSTSVDAETMPFEVGIVTVKNKDKKYTITWFHCSKSLWLVAKWLCAECGPWRLQLGLSSASSLPYGAGAEGVDQKQSTKSHCGVQ